MNRLASKIALVFGAASGIGAAVAVRFTDEGATVVPAGLTMNSPDAGLVAAGLNVIECDVTIDAQIQELVHATIAAHGRIDVLVNAAGVVATDEVAFIEDAQWHRMQNVNLLGSMRTMRAVLPSMLSRRSGSIVNVASVAAFNAGADGASYAASKAGLIALTRSAAHAYGGHGVRINALCPGWIDTPMSRHEMQELGALLGSTAVAAHDRTVERIALRRMGRADEMAAACLFLASDDSSFVTGTALVADGGSRIPATARAI